MPPPSSADRPLRDLSEAVEAASPSGRDAAAEADIPVAATVVLLRDTADGLEVLLIERPDRGSFAAAWVFPGGRVEAGDRAAAGDGEEDAARGAGARETREEVGVALDPATLVPLSCWEPPAGLALRIRTWFFVAPAADAEVVLSAEEAVAAAWLRPADALARHGRGTLTLYPPTWVTLHALSDHPDSASVIAGARLAGVERFRTVARRGGEGPVLLWHGDAEYEVEGDAASRARHRLEIGVLPWRYQRTL